MQFNSNIDIRLFRRTIVVQHVPGSREYIDGKHVFIQGFTLSMLNGASTVANKVNN